MAAQLDRGTHKAVVGFVYMPISSIQCFPLRCVNNINNQVIISLIIQKQHRLTALLSKYNPLPTPGLKNVITETVVVHCYYAAHKHTKTHTHKHTLTHLHTEGTGPV